MPVNDALTLRTLSMTSRLGHSILACCVLLAAPGAPAATQVSERVVTELPNAPGRAPRAIEPSAPKADGSYEIDLLMLYTSPAAESLGGWTRALDHAAERVTYANRIFTDSLVNVRYRLVGVAPYPESTEPNVPRELPDVASVVALRNAHGADLVSVLRSPADLACGQAMTFNGGVFASEDTPRNVDPERDAYSVVFCLHDRTFPHELGHNLGAGHDYLWSGQRNPITDEAIPLYEDVIGAGYWRTYAHGWRCGTAGPGSKYCSIMHYCDIPHDKLGDFFSNPRLLRDVEACGAEGTLEAEQADNARSISEAAPYVAAYRGGGKSLTPGDSPTDLGMMEGIWLLLIAWAAGVASRRQGRKEWARAAADPNFSDGRRVYLFAGADRTRCLRLGGSTGVACSATMDWISACAGRTSREK